MTMVVRFFRAGLTPAFAGALSPVPNGTTDDPGDDSNLNANASSDAVFIGDITSASVSLFADTTCSADLLVSVGPTATGPWVAIGSASVNPSLASPLTINAFASGRAEYVRVTTSNYVSGNPRAILNTGSGEMTGSDARSYKIDAGVATFVVTGRAANPLVGHLLTAAVRSFAVTGQSLTSMVADHPLVAGVQTFVMTPETADLVKASPPPANIAFDAIGAGLATSDYLDSVTWGHTVTGANPYLVVHVAFITVADIPTATYNGVSMALLGSFDTGDIYAPGKICMFGLSGPATGTHNVVITKGGASQPYWAVGQSVSYTGVNQGVPTGTYHSVATNGPNPSYGYSSAAGEVVIDACISPNAITISDQTPRWSQAQYLNGKGSEKAGAATTTMSWTASHPVGLQVIALKPA